MSKSGKRPSVLRIAVISLLSLIMIYSIARICLIRADYHAADVTNSELSMYRPPMESATPTADISNEKKRACDTLTENTSVIELQNMYPDVCGWLTLDGTSIDYCFAEAEDNEKYLYRSLDGKSMSSGNLFMDCRCERDLGSFNSIIYGHRMKNGTMFSDIVKFGDGDFFGTHTSGTVYLPYRTYTLETIAYMVVPDDDETMYDPDPGTEFLSYVRENARQYREVDLDEEDTIMTLSTCCYEYDGARAILVIRVCKG